MENIAPESLLLLVNTVQELSLARDLDTVMKIVRTAARKLTGADGATFVLKDGDKCFYADEDAIAPLWKGSRFSMSICISGWVMNNHQAVTIEDIYMDSRIPAAAYKPTFVKSMAMVPIRTMDPLGAIGNYWAVQRKPSENEVWLLQSLADITAVTLENVKVYNELEQRVKDRTTQLEFINKELEAFSYSVSHDLRAPLRAIRGYTIMLHESLSGNNDDKQYGLAEKILNNTDSMAKLIDDLLVFFRTGQAELYRFPVSMLPMVNAIIENITGHEKQRHITFEIGNLPDTEADPSLIKQVWENLISNAVKYTGQKEEAIISVGAETNRDEVIYHVKDNGAGFSMKYAHKLFKVFQRLHSNDEFEGTGIGLATVHRIILRHGGRIWAEAEPDKGAAFYFSLPAAAKKINRE